MKTTLLVAVLAISFVSCKKDPFTIPDVTPQPSLEAKVYPYVNQPREAALGDAATIFYVGERVTIYVPYNVNHDYLNHATITISDENGNMITSMEMTPSTDMMANELNIPMELQGANFLFANIDLGEEYAGKSISIKTQVSGGQTVSDDTMQNAFSVQL
jgi:hypothetical protein